MSKIPHVTLFSLNKIHFDRVPTPVPLALQGIQAQGIGPAPAGVTERLCAVIGRGTCRSAVVARDCRPTCGLNPHGSSATEFLLPSCRSHTHGPLLTLGAPRGGDAPPSPGRAHTQTSIPSPTLPTRTPPPPSVKTSTVLCPLPVRPP